LPDIPDGEAAICARCDALLQRAARDSLAFARISAVVTALLFALALALPLVTLSVLGRVSRSTVFTGADELSKLGLPALGLVVLATLILMPAVKLAVELTCLFGVRVPHPPRWLPWLFGCLERVSPWSMVEVFLLGSFVAYSRLKAIAHVEVGLAVVALGGVMLSMVATDATLDREAIWQELEARTFHPRRSKTETTAAPSNDACVIGCDTCGRVTRAAKRDPCVRCRHRLSTRRGGFDRVWALLVAAALLYVPANVLPVMTVKRLGKGSPTTILNGVIELAHNHLWPLALLVLLASIIVPVVKLVSLFAMLVMTHRRSPKLLAGRTRLFRFVKFIGRWSMIDIFMLAVLVGVVRFGRISSILPGMGAVAFCAVVLLTMLATELFDPRLMWDAAGREEAPDQGVVAHEK
jgi:paraquat-inducible protein A